MSTTLADFETAYSKWAVAICPHIDRNPADGDILSELLKAKFPPHERFCYCHYCDEKLNCKVCKAVFKIEITDMDDCTDKAVVLTKWLDLGSGTPSDWYW